jgi:penicillin amidase
MDYLRRKGWGRLAEVLGPEAISSDLVARTVGLNRMARAEWSRLPNETAEVLQSFTIGVNLWIEQCVDRLPIEFDLLGYRPEPWTECDSLVIETEFRWYLTGRLPVIVMPELAKRVLGDGPLYREFLLGEEDGEAIIPPEAYAHEQLPEGSEPHATVASRPRDDIGQATGDPECTGSNNWVVAGRFCRSGMPMVASDPHIAFEAVSCWYEAHLSAGSFNVAGMAYVGMPAILVGRNERIAWGITNNICSQRDLYQERTHPDRPGCFAFAGEWERARELVETIEVRGGESVTRTIRFSRHGPVVDEILPPPANRTGPVTLKWLGAYHGGWLTALLGINRAGSVAQFREAVRPWHVPTFNLVVADVDGAIAVQCAGRIPLRKRAERGYRPGWDPEHEWIGILPFEGLPHCVNPQRGWLATANNRLAADDYPYPLYGTWPAGYRAARIRQRMEGVLQRIASRGPSAGFTMEDFRDIQHDSVSLRAKACVPHVLGVLHGSAAARVVAAARYLEDWDCRVEPDSVAATLFNTFFAEWTDAVVRVRFRGVEADLLTRQADGIACRLLAGDKLGWFSGGERESTIRRVFDETLDRLAGQLGDDMNTWQWGRLHQLPFQHVLAHRGDLAVLLNHGGGPIKGDGYTVCNTGGSGADWRANLGGGYRMVADLADPGLWAVDGQSQSGHPGSPNYRDQFRSWYEGEYHLIPLDRSASELSVTVLEPPYAPNPPAVGR